MLKKIITVMLLGYLFNCQGTKRGQNSLYTSKSCPRNYAQINLLSVFNNNILPIYELLYNSLSKEILQLKSNIC